MLEAFPAWPAELRDRIIHCHGLPGRVERLGGMSGALVWRVTCDAGSAIVKHAPRLPEVAFYRVVAPQLHEQGVPLPRCEWACADVTGDWLLLEDLPAALPRARWAADPQVLAALQALHRTSMVSAPSSLFRPSWDNAMTAAALDLLPELSPDGRALITAAQARCQDLFAPLCWISGDPNPANWGMRADGSVVLFDWERFGRGTPAIDLAITMPGFGDPALAGCVATGYLGPDADADTIADLAGAIIRAKLWSAIEFLGFARAGELADMSVANAVAAGLPAWLTTIAPMLS